jgi:hypothetical protein
VGVRRRQCGMIVRQGGMGVRQAGWELDRAGWEGSESDLILVLRVMVVGPA